MGDRDHGSEERGARTARSLRSAPSARAAAAATAAGLLLALTVVLAIAGVDVVDRAVAFHQQGTGLAVFAFAVMAAWLAVIALSVGVFADPARAGWLTLAAVILVRVSLALAIVFMFVFPFLPQMEGKSMTLRAVIYPVVSSAIPVAYWLRGRGTPYPGVVDLAWSFTFTLDIVSNDLHWYGVWSWWDDWIHFLNAIPYTVVAVAVLLAAERAGRIRVGFMLAVVFAFLVDLAGHALWEMWEDYMDRFFGTNLQPGGMTEASSNMLWALAGGAAGAGLLAWWRARRGLGTVVDPLALLAGRVFGTARDAGDASPSVPAD